MWPHRCVCCVPGGVWCRADAVDGASDGVLYLAINALVLQLCTRTLANIASCRPGAMSLVESRAPAAVAEVWNLLPPGLQATTCCWTMFNVCRQPHYLPHVANAGGVVFLAGVMQSVLSALELDHQRASLVAVDRTDTSDPASGGETGAGTPGEAGQRFSPAARQFYSWSLRRLATALSALTCFSHTRARVARGGGIAPFVRTVMYLVRTEPGAGRGSDAVLAGSGVLPVDLSLELSTRLSWARVVRRCVVALVRCLDSPTDGDMAVADGAPAAVALAISVCDSDTVRLAALSLANVFCRPSVANDGNMVCEPARNASVGSLVCFNLVRHRCVWLTLCHPPVWCGVVCCCVVWCGLWRGVVWCGVWCVVCGVWCGVVW
jgi:hypothetical protein